MNFFTCLPRVTCSQITDYNTLFNDAKNFYCCQTSGCNSPSTIQPIYPTTTITSWTSISPTTTTKTTITSLIFIFINNYHKIAAFINQLRAIKGIFIIIDKKILI